ncbi:MAG: carboxymuconolactone decarboxylase family protein [Candidatus Promineifilaceae bacterium]|nr:carboxymuconolactone decarboxylase family protein [Candidatus Promineifilaceae bacterium]
MTAVMSQTPTRSREAVESEIREMMGIVPSFFDRIPDNLLDAEWQLFKQLQFGDTLIPHKYKELLMLAVHAETRCEYCTLFHTEAAKLYGATEEEIQEAIHLAKFSIGWSAYLNGTREDYDRFAAEVEQIGAYLSKPVAA